MEQQPEDLDDGAAPVSLQDQLSIDPKTLRELNDQASIMADSVTHLMGGLQAQLQAVRLPGG